MTGLGKPGDDAVNAEVLFAVWVGRVESGEHLEFEELVRAHPAIADELRRLHEDWKLFAPILGKVVPGLIASDSAVVVPSLSGGPDTDDDASSADLMAKLGIHAPNEGRYRFRAVLGRGGGGVVLKVWDTKLNRPLAMKVVLGRNEEQPSGDTPKVDGRTLTRFVDEARIASQLNHPGIVPVHELGADDTGRAFFTMKLVNGEDLSMIFERVRTGADGWNQTRALGVLLRVCEAMSYAHDKGVIHRDLKPANVMVGAYGEVHVMDWGLARVIGEKGKRDVNSPVPKAPASVVDSVRKAARDAAPESPLATQVGSFVGTPSYTSPEQARGELDSVGTHSDVYAIGAMLYHLIAGEPPYMPREVSVPQHVVLLNVIHGPPKLIEAVAPRTPAELVAICDRAMNRDVAMRYASMQVLADDLRAYLEGRVVAAHRSDFVAIARKWVRRNRGLSTTIAIAAGLLIVAFTFVVMVQHEVDAKNQALHAAAIELHSRNRYDHRLRAEDLIVRAEELYPAVPALAPAFEGWLWEADHLLPERASHASDRALLGERSDSPVAMHVDRVLAAFDSLQSTRDEVADRCNRARTLTQRSIDEFHVAWGNAIGAIARSSRYKTGDDVPLLIEPQIGLVPLYENPASGLWEFWLLDSGDAPTAYDGSIGSTTGIVLILVPGAENRLIPGDTFLYGKYEVTQGQWRRVMGNNPAYFSSDRRTRFGEQQACDDRHPIESVTWLDASLFCERLDLRLPSRTQWIHCASGRGTGPRWTGNDELALIGKENVRYDPESTGRDLADQYAFHAPVGSFVSNDYGVFDALGNVSEWLADASDENALPSDSTVMRLIAGGDFQSPLSMCTTANRSAMRADWKNYATGLRVARSLQP